VRIAEISADCPLARLGIKTGDVLVRLDGIEILNLRGYAQELKKRKPGDIVELTLISGGVEKTVKTILQEQEKK
jgi:S1-C subfamily serine protease